MHQNESLCEEDTSNDATCGLDLWCFAYPPSHRQQVNYALFVSHLSNMLMALYLKGYSLNGALVEESPHGPAFT